MTTLELWLLVALCYLLTGIIWLVAHYFKACNDMKKDIDDYYNLSDHFTLPTSIDGLLIMLFWPFYMLFLICIALCNFVDWGVEFLEKMDKNKQHN